MFATEHGMDDRGGRYIVGDADDFYEIAQGEWYGWPDFPSGIRLDDLHWGSDGQGRAGTREGRAGAREGRAGTREGRAGTREGRAGTAEIVHRTPAAPSLHNPPPKRMINPAPRLKEDGAAAGAERGYECC